MAAEASAEVLNDDTKLMTYAVSLAPLSRLALITTSSIQDKGFQEERVMEHVVLDERYLLSVLFPGTHDHDVQCSLKLGN